ncbi:hypothetical protein NDU88_005444 [Pleurodeles waltl]|uniref:Uncharacterized protein n=1 Tax=Pleurodeles waltl TaxID=8319 RepID=A0AAV7TU99_PLEWA|nr:hypothetical protein NDU88_005444 [Pleurodeles waltl]
MQPTSINADIEARAILRTVRANAMSGLAVETTAFHTQQEQQLSMTAGSGWRTRDTLEIESWLTNQKEQDQIRKLKEEMQLRLDNLENDIKLQKRSKCAWEAVDYKAGRIVLFNKKFDHIYNTSKGNINEAVAISTAMANRELDTANDTDASDTSGMWDTSASEGENRTAIFYNNFTP